MPRILIAVTSCDRQGVNGPFTGYELLEVSHPYLIFRDQGYEVDFVSPQGGNPPIEKYLLSDPISRAFLEDEDAQLRIRTSRAPTQLRPGEYAAMYFAGGHGALWDFADCPSLQSLAASIYQAGGVIGAACQGLAGLLNVRLLNGESLLKDKRIHGSSAQAEACGVLSLTRRLQAQGAILRPTHALASPVVVSGRLVTSQDPAAAESVARKMIQLLAQRPLPFGTPTTGLDYKRAG